MSQSEVLTNNRNCAQNEERFNFTEEEEAPKSKFKVKNYIPSRYRIKHLCYIGSSILVVFILMTIVLVVSRAKDNVDFHDKLFFVINNTNVMLHDLETDNTISQLETTMNLTVSAFEIHRNNHMYWVEDLMDVSQLVVQINGSRKVLLREKRFEPNALTFDPLSGNIYATDGNTGLLIALNVRSGYFCILLTDLIRPHDLALDSEEGNIFILQHLHSIVRANMDGSEPVQVVTSNEISALTIDTSRKRLYWTNDYTDVESSNYDGEKRQSIFADTTTIASITIHANRLFWISPTDHQSTNLLSCEIDLDGTCKKRSTHKINVTGNVTSIRGYRTLASSASNPCQVDNDGCEQLCFPSGRNESSCACRMGWQLNSDQRSCQEVRDFVLYPYGDVVRTCSLDGEREVYWPTPYEVKKLDAKTEINFDYDLKNDYFYFTDDHHIHRTKLKSYSEQETVLSVDKSDMIIEDIAYDWFTGNMYYGQRHVNASLEHSLMVFNVHLEGVHHKTLGVFDDDHFKARSYAMALHPAMGYLFVAMAQEHDDDTTIYRVKLNDIELRFYHFFAFGVQDHRFFTIDYATDRLYAIHENGETTSIGYKPVDSSKLNFPGVAYFTRARTVGVHQQWLYLSNFSSIYRFDKETVGDRLRIAPRVEDPTKKIIGVRIISEDVLLKGSDNPCAKNNGGYEQFCFSGDKAKCDCEDGKEVRDDGRCY